MNKKNRISFLGLFLILMYFSFIYIFFKDILNKENIVLDLSFKTIDFAKEDINLWKKIKKVFHLSNIFLFAIYLINFIKNNYYKIKINLKNKNILKHKNNLKDEVDLRKLNEDETKKYLEKYNQIKINIGFNNKRELISLEGKSLYQNILITGSIGSGKTQSAILPIVDQLIGYKKENQLKKICGLILDVKGNFCNSIEKIAKKHGRKNDIIKIELKGKYKYNPLDKPNLKPQIIANRLKSVLMLLSSDNTEIYWLDKAEQLIAECIKFIRLYNKGYVNFVELSKIIFDKKYYIKQKNKLKNEILKSKLSKEDIFNLNSFFEYFENEFLKLDDRTSSIIKSEISRITNIFVSDFEINKSFSPPKEEINFYGFKDVIKKGKIVVLNMNLSENTILAKIIATYLKLDFQGEVLAQLKNSQKINRTSIFVCDEYQEYVTKTDANFYSQSREAKCINVVSTQSYVSIKNTLKDKEACEVIIQNLLNKIWFRNDDKYTVESAISQIGKVYKEKISRTISENSKDSEYNYLLKKFVSTDSNLSESINKSKNLENLFEIKDFTQKLKIFEAIIFFTNNNDKNIIPEKIKTIPQFKREENNEQER